MKLFSHICANPVVLVGMVISGVAPAEETADVAKVLAQRVLDPQLPLEEVQAFTEARVLPFPEMKSRDEWQRYADQLRQNTLERVVFRGESARWRDAPAKVEWLETIAGGPGYRIRKLRYEALHHHVVRTNSRLSCVSDRRAPCETAPDHTDPSKLPLHLRVHRKTPVVA